MILPNAPNARHSLKTLGTSALQGSPPSPQALVDTVSMKAGVKLHSQLSARLGWVWPLSGYPRN